MVTYGFYNSYNHDRRYDAKQFGSIFDGIVRDGVFMSIGEHFNVTESGNGMMILVGTGRAWFDHTWTLNDAKLPLIVPQSEIIMNRIDAVVIETNSTQSVRANTIKIIKGTPSSNPSRPALVHNEQVHQYPLAYIQVNANVTSIRQGNITNMIGTSATPFVTGILDSINIDTLIAQWKDQWDEYRDFWETEWEQWYLAQTREIQEAVEFWLNEWNLWSENYKNNMIATKDEWNTLWQTWYYTYTTENQQSISKWQSDRDAEFYEWFNGLKDLVDADTATTILGRVQDLTDRVETLEEFADRLTTDHAVYYRLENEYFGKFDYVLDDTSDYVLDSDTDKIITREFQSEGIQNSDGVIIESKAVFCVSCERRLQA